MTVDKIMQRDRVIVKNMVRTEVSNIDGISNFSQEVANWRSWSLSRGDANGVQDILVNFDGYFSHFIICHLGFHNIATLHPYQFEPVIFVMAGI